MEDDDEEDDDAAEDVDDHGYAEDKVEEDKAQDDDVEKEEEHDFEEEDEKVDNVAEDGMEEEDIGARAVDLQVNISQGPCCAEIYGKSARAQNLGPHFARACAIETHCMCNRNALHKSRFTGTWKICRKERRGPDRDHNADTHTLREPAQSTCI